MLLSGVLTAQPRVVLGQNILTDEYYEYND